MTSQPGEGFFGTSLVLGAFFRRVFVRRLFAFSLAENRKEGIPARCVRRDEQTPPGGVCSPPFLVRRTLVSALRLRRIGDHTIPFRASQNGRCED